MNLRNSDLCRLCGSTWHSLALILFVITFTALVSPVALYAQRPPVVREIPWDFKVLMEAPAFRWLQDTGSVRALLYEGEQYRGRPTEIFAYYASPATIDPSRSGQHFPGVVLVHGGGGEAFQWWVEMWAERGYAAIAMDLRGNRPAPGPGGKEVVRLENGGPVHTRETSFWYVDSAFQVQWQYHAVAAIIRAHSLIRSMQEVDEKRTALTGISWGGYLTHIVRALDHRFSAAVAVYGCGFLQEGSFWTMKPIFHQMTKAQINRWTTYWDPAVYVPYGETPVLMINGTNDRYYYLDIFSKTAALAKQGKVLIINNLKHGHGLGARQKEVMAFIDHHLKGTEPLPRIERTCNRRSKVVTFYRSGYPLTDAWLYVTSDTTDNEHRNWKRQSLTISRGRVKGSLPEGVRAWYVSLTDQRGLSVTSRAVFTK